MNKDACYFGRGVVAYIRDVWWGYPLISAGKFCGRAYTKCRRIMLRGNVLLRKVPAENIKNEEQHLYV